MQTTTGDHERCWKCGGTGRIEVFAHIAKGVCFLCGGAGQIKVGLPASDRGKAIWTFVVGETVWQFEGIHHGPNCHTVARISATDTDTIDSVLLQAFRVGASRRNGVTILRCRVSPEDARKVWRAALDGMRPEDMDNFFLGGFVNGYGEPIGQWDTNSCAVSRNKLGIEVLGSGHPQLIKK